MEKKRSNRRDIGLFYLLIRDHLPAGVVEEVIQVLEKSDDINVYSNGFIFDYAQELADRLKGDVITGKGSKQEAEFVAESYEWDQGPGHKLKIIRTKRGYTQADLAKELGCTQAYISKIEIQQLPVSPSIARKLSKVLGIDLEELFSISYQRLLIEDIKDRIDNISISKALKINKIIMDE